MWLVLKTTDGYESNIEKVLNHFNQLLSLQEKDNLINLWFGLSGMVLDLYSLIENYLGLILIHTFMTIGTP